MFAAIVRFINSIIRPCACKGTITGKAKHSRMVCSTLFDLGEV